MKISFTLTGPRHSKPLPSPQLDATMALPRPASAAAAAAALLLVLLAAAAPAAHATRGLRQQEDPAAAPAPEVPAAVPAASPLNSFIFSLVPSE